MKNKKSISQIFRIAAAALLASFCFFSCDFFADGAIEEKPEEENKVNITNFEIREDKLSLKVGEMASLSMEYRPADIKITEYLDFDYDSSIVAVKTVTTTSIILEAIKEGTCYFKVTAGDFSDTCILKAEGFSDNYLQNQEPYIYSSTSIVDLKEGEQQKIYVSLYNGTVQDNNNYTWTIDNKEIASLSPTGQYCQIKGLSQGYAQITVRNSAAVYPYYIGVYVSRQGEQTTYITTTENIVSLYKNTGEKTISVSLVNPVSNNLDFQWENFAGANNEFDTSCLSFTANKDKCVLTPIKSGTACIRVKHPEATAGIPLDIIVRVITVVDNVYIIPEKTLVEVSDLNEYSIKSTLSGTASYDVDEFWYEVSDDRMIESYEVGDTFYFSGKHNGAVSLYIHHEKAEKARQVLILLSNQEGGSIDSSCYITTTQNFVKTKVGAEETKINISLKGGSEGDEKEFTWAVKQDSKSGSGDVIKLETTHGSVLNSRAVQSIYTNGSAVITPLNEGVATIIITHPKVFYPTEILVKVLSKDAVLEEPLYFKGDPIVRFLNSESYEYTVQLAGENKSPSDDSKIAFESDNETLKILSSSNVATLSSSASGNNISHINITHPKAENPKDVLVLNADTQEELDNMKAFYTDKKYYSCNVGDEICLYTQEVGFTGETDDEGNFTPFDWEAVSSRIFWTTSDSDVATVEKMGNDMPLFATVRAKSSGKATVKIEYDSCVCEWEITVYPEGVEIGKVETSIYLTTSQNVISLRSEGLEKTVSVSAVGLSENEFSKISWTSSDSGTVSVIGNGTSATITSHKEGEAVLTVDHEKSENTLKIYVRVGNEYVSPVEPVVYISTNKEVFSVLKDSGMQTLAAQLLNYSGDEKDTWKFSFSCDDESVVSIQNQFNDGKCYFAPKEAGQAVITVQNELCQFPKEILVVVANTEEELKGFKYLTTGSNVITVGEGRTANISVGVENSDDILLSGYSWSSANPKIAGISATTAATALITGNKVGTTEISVLHTSCSYPLKIIVQVVDPQSLAAAPYIQVSSAVQTLTVSDKWTEISAELVGGNDESKYNFSWSSSDSSILEVVGNHNIGKIRAKSAETTYVICENSDAPYPVQVLCICTEGASDSYSISLSSNNMITLEPQSKTTTINATLNSKSGSTDQSDAALFSGYLDVFGVVDLQFNDNSFYITPIAQGQTTLTVSHPKALYPKSVIIKVSKYSDFEIGSKNYYSVAAGETTYIEMKVPAGNVDTKIVYEVQNEKIASATGTKAVCSLTGLQEGNTLLKAKVIAQNNPDNILYEAEVYVTVTPADVSSTYITTGASIYTITKDTTKTLSADIIGSDVSNIDSRSLKWKCSDSSIITITGADATGTATGESVYVKALKPGETIITISHEKSPSDRILYIIVPGQEQATISLNKTYTEIEKGTKSATITATVDGDDYTEKDIIWQIEKVNGSDLARVLGSGKTVSLYGIKSGRTNIIASLPNGNSAVCQLEITDPKSLKIQRSTIRVQPNHTVELPYTISPDSDTVTVTYYADDSSGKDYVMVEDLGHSGGEGKILITGLSTGAGESSTTTCLIQTSSGSYAQCKIICSWDYYFKVNKSSISTTPVKPGSFTYRTNPQAEITVEAASDVIGDADKIVEVGYDLEPDDSGYYTGTIKVSPVAEGTTKLTVTATNPFNDDVIGTQTVTVNSFYSKLTPKIEISSSTGRFSYYDKKEQILHIGDGEEVNLKFGFEEQGATVSDLAVKGTPVYNDGRASFDEGTNRFVSSADKIVYEYKVIEGYAPYSSDGTLLDPFSCSRILYKDRKTTTCHAWGAVNEKDAYIYFEYRIFSSKGTEFFSIDNYEDDHCTHSDNHYDNDTYVLETGREDTSVINYRDVHKADADGIFIHSQPKRNPDLDGKVYDTKTFENCLFFYLPEIDEKYDSHSNYVSIKHEKGEIFYPCVSAVKRCTADKTIIATEDCYRLDLSWTYKNGKKDSVTIPVYIDTRNCHQQQQDGYEMVLERAIKGKSFEVYEKPQKEKMTVPDK